MLYIVNLTIQTFIVTNYKKYWNLMRRVIAKGFWSPAIHYTSRKGIQFYIISIGSRRLWMKILHQHSMNKVNNQDGWLRVSRTHFSISTHSETCLNVWSGNTVPPQGSWETTKWFLCLTPLVPGGQYGGHWHSCMLHHMSDLLATILNGKHFIFIHKISAATT